MRKPRKPDQCELCQRQVPHLTEHHLFPKSRHSDKKLVKLYGKERLRMDVAWLCSSCHKHVHKHLTERQLAYEFNSTAQLRAHTDIAVFVEWLATKPADFTPRNSRSARS